SAACRSAPQIRAFAKTMGASPAQTRLLLLKEMRGEMYFALIAAFARSISEVGAVMIVGGNIAGRTRVMTTAIALMRGMGDYSQAIALGIILLILAFAIQWLSDALRRERPVEENF
ncbi:MAG: hypothetical protein FWE09_06340, partial [Treponema sp.]|nr:hypothetical protein [Treponema sp.]